MSDTDSISRVQEKIVKVSAGFFNLIGTLQRDAQPTSIEQEGIISSNVNQQQQQNVALQEQTNTMVKDLVSSIEQLKQAILALPSLEEQKTENAAVELQSKDKTTLDCLQQKIKESELKLKELERAHAVLATAALKIKVTENGTAED